MNWPPHSPYLNPIENIRGLIIVYLHNRTVHPKNLLDLFHMLTNTWNTLPDSYFRNLIASMPKRIKTMCDDRAGPRKY